MSEALVVRESANIERPVELGLLRADDAKALVSSATDLASALADVIKKQELFSTIQGRRYVQCEGWTTLAAMLGVTPREVESREMEDGGYEAVVELARIKDGAIVGRASALCGGDEPLWAKRSKYARKSMAATRATGKACRMSFSWIMALAGYEVTPAEEIPYERERGRQPPHFDIQSDEIPAPSRGDSRGGEEVRSRKGRAASPKKEPPPEPSPPPVEEPPEEEAVDPDAPIGLPKAKILWEAVRKSAKDADEAKAVMTALVRALGVKATGEIQNKDYERALQVAKEKKLPKEWSERLKTPVVENI